MNKIQNGSFFKDDKGTYILVTDTLRSSLGKPGGITFRYVDGRLNGYRYKEGFFRRFKPVSTQEAMRLKLEWL